jgi:hypothetical protein
LQHQASGPANLLYRCGTVPYQLALKCCRSLNCGNDDHYPRVQWRYDYYMKFSKFSEGLRGERGPEWKDPPFPVPRPVTVTLSAQLANKLRRYADSHEMSLDEAAESLLSRALDQLPLAREKLRQNRIDRKETPEEKLERLTREYPSLRHLATEPEETRPHPGRRPALPDVWG